MVKYLYSSYYWIFVSVEIAEANYIIDLVPARLEIIDTL